MDRRSNIRLQAWVLAAGLGLMSIKFFAWRLTHSNTILSDALESIVNVIAGSFALYSLWLAAKPRDRGHPYGHGKVEFISAGVEGGLVVLAGALIIWRAVWALLNHTPLHDLGTGILLAALAGLLNLLMGVNLKRRGRAAHSITMEASGEHLLSDAWSTGAMIGGLGLIHFTGLEWLDQLFAIVFACYIMYTGMRVFRRSVAGIMDEADPELAREVIGILESHRKPQWVDIHNFRTIKFGPVLHIDCHVTLPWYYSLEKAHQEIADLEELVNAKCAREVELFIHMDPCVPRSCTICALGDCPQRKAPFTKRIHWTLDTALVNSKHGSEGT